MATKRISELQLRSDFDATCNVPVDDASQSWRTTGQQLRNFIAPLTTIGDLLFATTAGVADRLGIGTATQQVLKPVSGVPGWAYPHSVQRSASTTDAISATTDHVILYDATSGAFTATLPTAASVTGKTYILKKIDSSVNAVTIATTSSQTIDGVTTNSLNSQYECLKLISDGSNWQILSRRYPSAWTAWTPTGTLTTNTTYTGFERRIGDSNHYKILMAFGGANTQGAITVTLNKTIDTAKILSTASGPEVLGTVIYYDAAGGSGSGRLLGSVTYNSSTTVLPSLFMQDSAQNHYLRNADSSSGSGPVTYASGDKIMWDFVVPISGWKG